MKKIPTLFRRNPDDMRHVLPEVTPGCEWVINGEGTPTRKFDGTCTMFDGERWWARREVKPGKSSPDNWVEVDADEVTGKRVGWEPIEQSSFAKYHAEAVENLGRFTIGGVFKPEEATFELIGPKINSNPEGYESHSLVRHGLYLFWPEPPRHFDGLREWLYSRDVEGIVWHHDDGRMVKIKRRDFY